MEKDGDKIRKYLRENKITQLDFAKKLHISYASMRRYVVYHDKIPDSIKLLIYYLTDKNLNLLGDSVDGS